MLVELGSKFSSNKNFDYIEYYLNNLKELISKYYSIKDYIVYPKHGVGEIISTEAMEIANIKTLFYVVKMEQSKLTIRVPLDKKHEVGLRKISSKKVIEEVFYILKLKQKDIHFID